jgi:polysaccharide export outer membrane protein
MKCFSLFCFATTIFYATSCTTQKATTQNYLEKVNDTTGRTVANIQPPVVQKGDLLSIKIFSKANGLDPRPDAAYNLQEASAAGGGNAAAGGFMVDQMGNIEYPQLGTLHLEGLSKEQVAGLIKSKIEEDTLLREPVGVIVRFLNFKISVLGEVNSPGTFTLPTERVTILEALGLSGDITLFGKKNNVMVVRENNGEIERGRIDLTSDSMFLSPYYRLQQNDVVFVESNGKQLQQQQRQETAQQIGIATSIITAIALILNFIR